MTENELGEISKVSFGILKLGDASFRKTKNESGELIFRPKLLQLQTID